MLAVALEGEHDVDQVLEHARPGEQRPPWSRGRRARRAAPWAFAVAASSAAHSRTCATEPGRRLDPVAAHRLDRVDEDEARPELAPRLGERLDAGLGEREHAAAGSRRGARRAAAPARGSPRRSRRAPARRCGRARRRAGARASTCRCPARRRGARPSPARGRRRARGRARRCRSRRAARPLASTSRKRHGLPSAGARVHREQVRRARLPRSRLAHGLLDQALEAAARRAAAEPARLLRAALGADVDAAGAGHGRSVGAPHGATTVDHRSRSG